jgi:hypothetical protein
MPHAGPRLLGRAAAATRSLGVHTDDGTHELATSFDVALAGRTI